VHPNKLNIIKELRKIELTLNGYLKDVKLGSSRCKNRSFFQPKFCGDPLAPFEKISGRQSPIIEFHQLGLVLFQKMVGIEQFISDRTE